MYSQSVVAVQGVYCQMSETKPTEMTEVAGNSGVKKLKLTLKLNSSSSSSSALASSPAASPAASPATSPVKDTAIEAKPSISINEADAGVMTDLPSGLGNLKGRGRPKKAASAPKKPVSAPANSASAPASSSEDPPSASSEYAADLRSFVAAMKSFQPRKWAIKRPLSLELRNVGGYEIVLENGLWCTFTSELGSVHLSEAIINNTTTTSNSNSNQEDSNFEATCQCGKLFTDRSKFRKHAKIHEKDKKRINEPSSEDLINIEEDAKLVSTTPVISLKLKLKAQ